MHTPYTHTDAHTHTQTSPPPHQHRLAVISVELNTSNTLSSHLDQTKINSWLEDILCSHSDHFSLQYPAVTTYSRTLLGHGWLGPSKLLLLKRTLSWKNMGGPSLKLECWKVRFHAQTTFQSHFYCSLKDIWVLKSSCGLKSPIHERSMNTIKLYSTYVLLTLP